MSLYLNIISSYETELGSFPVGAQDGRGEKEMAILEVFSLAVKVFCSDVLKE